MTRERAITLIKSRCPQNPRKPWGVEYKNAHEMAIKALKQEPCEDLVNQRATTCKCGGYCEWAGVVCDKCCSYKPDVLKQQPCEDAISRQAAFDAFGLSEKTRKYGGDHSGYDTLMKYEIQNVLEGLPPVTPQPKIGRWIDNNCSICGYGVKPWNNTPYCPNCSSYNGGTEKCQ